MNKYFVSLTIVFFTLATLSQDSDIVRVPKKRRITLNFGADMVKANAENPDLSNIHASKNFNWKKMIKIKENFIPEVESNGQAFEK